MPRLFLMMVLGVGALVGFGSGFASLAHGGWGHGDRGCPHSRGDWESGGDGYGSSRGDERGDQPTGR